MIERQTEKTNQGDKDGKMEKNLLLELLVKIWHYKTLYIALHTPTKWGS